MSECEICGINQEEYGYEFENYNGQTLCEDCMEEQISEGKKDE